VDPGIHLARSRTDILTEEDKQKILNWLRPVDQSDLQAAAIRKHEPGTGEWFLSGADFDRWKQQPGSSLWMYGSGAA
jgi:hypothetical protein